MLYVDTKLWLPDDLLARGDKTSMAASIEARVPLLDHKLVEFAASFPHTSSCEGLPASICSSRSPSVAARAGHLPEEAGIPDALSIWFRKEARAFARDVLSPAAIRRRGPVQPVAFVERLITENEAGSPATARRSGRSLSVELWHRLFIDSTVDA